MRAALGMILGRIIPVSEIWIRQYACEFAAQQRAVACDDRGGCYAALF